MKTSLLIMAAGIGSRFGGGIKQLAPVGQNGEIIMDYSVHDAIEAGFNKIIFVIRRDIEKDFMEIIGNRIEKICSAHNVETAYAFQSLDDIPGVLPEGRTKPWGTGQAVLAARDVIDSPFVVLNADDYYGKEAFVKLHDYLCENENDGLCMAGFRLKNTLSDNGSVTRGICRVNNDMFLSSVVETTDIVKTDGGASANGKELDADSYVSMNMWGLPQNFVKTLENGFETFFKKDVPKNPLKSEYLLPIIIGGLLEKGKVSVKVLESADKWFGVTYAEDKAYVIESFAKLTEEGVYRSDLFADLD